jgi:hypothetical protein
MCPMSVPHRLLHSTRVTQREAERNRAGKSKQRTGEMLRRSCKGPRVWRWILDLPSLLGRTKGCIFRLAPALLICRERGTWSATCSTLRACAILSC